VEGADPDSSSRSRLMVGAQYLGITVPVSLAVPTPAELEATRRLEQTILALGSFETQERARLRQEVSPVSS